MTPPADATGAVLTRLLGLHPKKIDLSLGRIQALLEKLGRPQDHLPPVIHVAGTNGKGSTVAFLRAMLEAAGKVVHVYTSPHLVEFHERIRLAGWLIADDRLRQVLEECEAANAGAPITFFEITTAAALLEFSRTPADYVLLEVGLGGRYDATNVIARPTATIITPVSHDHPEFLGTEIKGIALEKAGILKAGVPAIIAPQSEEAGRVIHREAARVGAPLLVAGEDFHVHSEHGRLIYQDEAGLLDLPLPKLPGSHQFDNAAAAIATLRYLEDGFSAKAIDKGLINVTWPARLQRLKGGPLVDLAPWGTELWLDGGHNAEGGRVLGEAMADFEDDAARPLILICGTLATKDTGAFLRAFRGLAQEVIGVPVTGDHAGRTADDVAAAARAEGIPACACASVPDALAFLKARSWAKPPRVLIAGSLYLAGEVLRLQGTKLM